MSKDNSLAGQCYDIETNEQGTLQLCLKPHRDHYVVDLIDVVTGQNVMPIFNPDSNHLPEIYNINDLNIVLQILFADEEDIPQIDNTTEISDWAMGTDYDDLDDLDAQARYLSDVSAVVRDLSKTTLADAIDRAGTDHFFRYGDVILKASFRHSPREEDE